MNQQNLTFYSIEIKNLTTSLEKTRLVASIKIKKMSKHTIKT